MFETLGRGRKGFLVGGGIQKKVLSVLMLGFLALPACSDTDVQDPNASAQASADCTLSNVVTNTFNVPLLASFSCTSSSLPSLNGLTILGALFGGSGNIFSIDELNNLIQSQAEQNCDVLGKLVCQTSNPLTSFDLSCELKKGGPACSSSILPNLNFLNDVATLLGINGQAVQDCVANFIVNATNPFAFWTDPIILGCKTQQNVALFTTNPTTDLGGFLIELFAVALDIDKSTAFSQCVADFVQNQCPGILPAGP